MTKAEKTEIEKRREELINKFTRNELTLYDFAKKYPNEYQKDKEFIDNAWQLSGKYASERVGILIGGGSQKARELWTYYILTALEINMPMNLNTETKSISEKYSVEDGVVWEETAPEDFYSSVGETHGFGQLFDPYCYGPKDFVRCNIITTPYSCDKFLSDLGKLDEPSHTERRIQFRIDLDFMTFPLTTCRNFQKEAWRISGEVYDILSRFSYVWTVLLTNGKMQEEFDISVDKF